MKQLICLTLILILSAHTCNARKQNLDNSKTLRLQYLGQRKNDPGATVETKLHFIDELIREHMPDVPYNLYLEKGALLRREGRPEDALSVYNEALRHCPADSFSSRLRLLSEKTTVAIQSYHYTEALESAYKTMESDMPDSLSRYGLIARLQLVDIYRGFRNPKNTEKYIESAKEFLARDKNMSEETKELFKGRILRKEALFLLEMNQVEEATDKIEQARKLKTDSLGDMVTNSLLSIISMKKGEIEQAEYYMRTIIGMNLPHSNTMAAKYYLISLLIDNGRTEEAENLIKSNLFSLQKMKGGPFEHMYYNMLYKISLQKGNYPEAVKWLEKAYRSNDSTNLSLLLMNASEIADKYEMELRQKEIENTKKQEKYKSLAIIGLIIIILSISVWVYSLIRRQRRRRDEIEVLQEKIQTIDERHSEELLETRSHLDERNQKITSMALNLAMVDAALSDIRTTAADTSISKSEALNKIQQLLKNLKIQHRSWEVFKQGFEEINPHFFEKLYKVCPGLSNAEIRMATFMLLNLPMSTVADMTNRSVRTIGTIRYNVRRKLCITGNAEAWMTRLSMADDKEIERLAAIVKENDNTRG